MRLAVPLLFGLLGAAVLIGLGVWQLQRLQWKEGVIARIEARIGAAPVALPPAPDPEADAYLPVRLDAAPAGEPLRVLGSWRGAGTGFRIVAPMATPEGRRLMVDLGVLPLHAAGEGAAIPLPEGPVAIVGNLAWPDDAGPGTPEPEGDLWYGRDVDAMADALGTEPLMVVARAVDPPAGPSPSPVGVEGIPNSHLGYAIQWFGLAAVWLGMTGYLLWRIRRRSV